MDYKSKYLKYKEKYLKLSILLNKSKSFNNLIQYGGVETIEHTDDNFLNKFEQIMQYGQRNCGIFISKDKTRLIKCVSNINMDIETKLVKIKDSYPEFKIFPEIYNIHKFNDKIFIEMDKFDGDLTQLLYEILPRHILGNMVKESKITSGELHKYYELFQMLIAKTFHTEPLRQISCSDPIIVYLIKNRNVLPEVMSIAEENYEKYKNNNYMDIELKEFNNIKVGKSTYLIESQISTYEKLEQFFSDGVIKYTIYLEFIEKYKIQFRTIFEGIKKQILRLQLLLYNIGLTYADMKLDNFAYRLSNLNYPHLGEIWNNNKIFDDKYLFISIIDWDSGLFDSNDTPDSIIRLCNDFYSTKYGQYNFTNICYNCPILRDCNNNMLGLNEDGYIILSSEYELEDSKYDFKSIEEVIAYVDEGNEVLFNI